MKKIIFLTVVALFLLSGCQPYEAPETAEDTMEDKESMTEEGMMENESYIEETQMSTDVEIRNFEFNPATVQISAGGTVTWTNYDNAKHTATSDESGIFDSGLLSNNESWTYTFDEAGKYNYHCTPHPYMEGVVIVK